MNRIALAFLSLLIIPSLLLSGCGSNKTPFASNEGIGTQATLKPVADRGQPPLLEKYTSIHFVGRERPAKGGGGKTNFTCTNESTRWKEWVRRARLPLPASWRFDYSNGLMDGVGQATFEAQVRASFDEWNYHGSTHPAGAFFVEDPSVTTPNIVTWATSADLGSPNALADATIWVHPITKQIVQFRVRFNIDHAWAALGTMSDGDHQSCDPAGNVFDLWDVASQEIAHSFNLDHAAQTDDWMLTMYPYSNPGEVMKRSPGVGDLIGIGRLYGFTPVPSSPHFSPPAL